MTPTLRFEDINASFVFEIKTNLLPNNDSFTICEIVGLSEAEIALGIDLKQLPTTLVAMKTLAYDKGLKLTYFKADGTSEVLSALNANIIYYGGLGLGIDNI